MSQSDHRSFRLEDAKRYLLSELKTFPRFVIVLGSGLASLLKGIEVEREILMGQIPHFKSPSVEGHIGKIVVGKLSGVRVACMQGRLHYYEGYSMEEIVFPYRAFGIAGAEVFVLTNAAGGVHKTMRPMDLLLVEDHINLMGTNPLMGPNLARCGARFPDMTYAYDPQLNKIIRSVAKRLKIALKTGTYLALHGPSYETPAEIKFYKLVGADVVGMSTVPEVIALNHMKKRVVAISCITNMAAGVTTNRLVHEEVLENAKKVQTKFAKLVSESVREMNQLYEKA